MFRIDDEIFRGSTAAGLADWTAFAESGLLSRLTSTGEVIATDAADPAALAALRTVDPGGAWVAALRHERLPFVSYPYEWTFSMLKDAALLQLRVTRDAFAADLAIKDATPYNVQWRGASPVFVDIGSFERARAGEPWLGYRQFCMLFLYPLLLEAYRGVPFQPWLRGSLEGISPAEARALLRGRVTLRRGVLRHVALHATLERSHADGTRDVRRELREAGFDKGLVEANLKGLERLVTGLESPGVRPSGATTTRRAATPRRTRGRRSNLCERRCVSDPAHLPGTWAATTDGTRALRRRRPPTRSRSTRIAELWTASIAH